MEEGEVEAETRLENISELSNKAVAYWEDAEEPTLDGISGRGGPGGGHRQYG